MSENKFNGMGKIYSKYRPAYSFNFIDYLFTNVGISQSSCLVKMPVPDPMSAIILL